MTVQKRCKQRNTELIKKRMRCGELVKAVVSYGRGAVLSVRHATQQLIGLLQLREQQALHHIHDWARELSATLTTHEERLSVEALERESLLREARGVVRGEGCVVSPLHLLASLRQQLSQEPNLHDPHLPQINPFRKDEVNQLAQQISQFLEVERNDSQNLLFITPTTRTDAEDTLSSFQQSPADLNVSSLSTIENHMESFRSENTVSTNSTDMLFCNDSTYMGDIESPDVALTKPVPRSLLLLQRDARKYLDSHSPTDDRKIEGCGRTQRSGVGGEECHVSVLQFGEISNLSNIIQKDDDGGFLLPQDCSKLQEPLYDKSKLLLEGLKIEPADSTSNVSSGASSVTIKEDINTQVKSSNTLPLNQRHVSSTWDKKLKLLKWNNKWEMLGARPKITAAPSEADRDERSKDCHMLPADAVGGMMKRSPSLTSLHSTLSTTSTALKPSKVTALLMEEVEVVHIKSPSLFYVQRHLDQAKARRFFKKINAVARKSNPMMEAPRCGQVYLGQYTHDDSWYRAVVNLVVSDKIHVEYIDYGNSEELPFSRLRRCPPEYQLESVPSFALVCGLHEVMPARGNSWDTEAIHTFTELVVSVSLQLFVITYTTTNNITKCQVELRRPWKTTGVSNDLPLSVREVLVFLEYAVFINESPQDAYKKSREAESRKRYFQPDEIPFGGDGCTVLMSSLTSPDQFYLQLESNMAHLDKLMNDLQFYYSNPKIHCSVDWRLYAPRLGMACVAQYSCDSKWYRALVEDLPARHQVDVKYVDYGNRERLWYNKIYKITDDFLALPIQAIPCCLADIKPVNDKWPDDIVVQMVNLCEPDQLKATFNTIENDVCSVYLMVTEEEGDVDIAEELINLGIAIPSHIGNKLGKTERNHIGLHHIIYETPHKKGMVKSKRALSLLQKKKGLMIGDVKPFSNQYIEVEYLTLILPQCYIHVRPLSSTALYKQLQIQLKEDVEKYESDGGSRDGIDVSMGELCVVRLSRPPHFARAKVLSVVDTRVKVLLIDSGGTETVCISELYPLLEMLGRAKPLGVLVSLCDLLPPGGLSKWPGVTLDRLTEELTSHSSLYVVRKEGSQWDEELQSDILAVELGWMMEVDGGPFSANSVLHVSINDLLVDDGLAIPHRYPNQADVQVCEDVKVENPDSTTTINTPLNDLSSPGVNEQEIQVEECVSDTENMTTATVETNDVSLSLVQQWLPAPLPTITTFTATPSYVDYDGCIYLQPQTHTRTLELIRESQTIQFAGSNPTDYDLCWSPGDPVVAQFYLDKKWYRASVNKV
ncbi:hypothetical protein Pcinc_039757 [Petrolisthes cinctipes]|uniref:Tudor domain-containing protein n=1 Tax=Petrolisthes cinctipes TaxID=88211 RepID=A0AAE1BNB8_PETCI|nr:hypothetical protein Pcinc_039757 [Petrolisthes cinctipes]